ncbi:MAG: nitrate/nitrite transporter NrtS [Pseudomonadota bacterium]|jgi:hypothetical protein|nr:hypothetical protein [Halieaceae bacterium]MEC7780042.1 nitrate/nitrite transporter NrtS [Pseudomonadota bacterium]MEC8075834.1 nitrate/nitrite transporter NrtS [Pseudomonadota bacterium]MEC8143807.1 nitrate/nitrite transporter NrtS [Pseudomonadota bacterium]MEC8346584.1 nitrate/nitrite transporter NrtS [Pseudomonadota bacterium]|tara:strand:- start:1670 stop:1888 length:219 start_codon:yes stop_codon:yes gene_type:complete
MFEPSLFRRDIHLRAFKVAIVVGCILATINHGDAIFAHAMTTSSWLKVLLTFCVPYCVSWYSAVKTDTANIP